MFKVSIKGKKIKEAIVAQLAMVDEARFNLSPTGISVKAVDPANVAMVAMELTKEAFESYEATDGVLGIDLMKLMNFIEQADAEDVIEIELDEKEHKLKLKVHGINYTMSLIDPNAMRKEPKVPALDLPVNIIITGVDFKYGMKAADKVSDYVKMGMNPGNFYMMAVGDTDDVTYEIPIERLKITKSSEVASLFAIEYLIKIQKLAEKTGELTIILGKDYPIKIGFPISEGKGNIQYMIAPRVESEDK